METYIDTVHNNITAVFCDDETLAADLESVINEKKENLSASISIVYRTRAINTVKMTSSSIPFTEPIKSPGKVMADAFLSIYKESKHVYNIIKYKQF